MTIVRVGESSVGIAGDSPSCLLSPYLMSNKESSICPGGYGYMEEYDIARDQLAGTPTLINIFHEPDFYQRLIWHITLVSFNFDTIK